MIPARSEVIVAGEFADGEAIDALGIVEVANNFQERHSLLVARTLVQTNQSELPL